MIVPIAPLLPEVGDLQADAVSVIEEA